MPMAADDIAAMIRTAIPDAEVQITDWPGTAITMPPMWWPPALQA